MAVVDGVIKKPVEMADLQRLVGVVIQRTVGGVTQRKISGDLGVTIGADVGDTIPDDAGGTAWTVVGRTDINPMAKYKPIRNSKIKMLAPEQGGTPSDRYVARFGFAAITPKITFDGTNLDPHGRWEYLKPRGGGQSEPYRITDFLNEANLTGPGYDAGALPPFAFGVEGLELTYNTTADGIGGVGLPLYVNSGVNSYYINGGWRPETCMLMSELLNFYSGGAYIAFAVRDITEPTGGFVAVVTRHKLKTVSSSVPTVILYSKYMMQSGMLSPEVALLHEGGRAGHTFRFIAFLWSTFPTFQYQGVTYNENNAEYSILSTTPNFTGDSLEFIDNIDRQEAVAYLVQGGITGLTGFIQGPGVTLTMVGSAPVIYNGREYYKYQIGGTVYGTFTTPSGHWNPDGDVRIHLRISGDGIPSYVDPDTGNFEYSVNVPMPTGSTTYNNVALINFSTLSELAYIYVEPAVAKEEKPYINIVAYATPSYAKETVYIEGVIKAEAPRVTP